MKDTKITKTKLLEETQGELNGYIKSYRELPLSVYCYDSYDIGDGEVGELADDIKSLMEELADLNQDLLYNARPIFTQLKKRCPRLKIPEWLC